MEEEIKPQIEENAKESGLKFSLWFYVAIAVCMIVFVIVSAVTAKVCYWAAAIGFSLFFAEFLRLFLKCRRALFIVVMAVSAAAVALMLTLWIMRLCGMG